MASSFSAFSFVIALFLSLFIILQPTIATNNSGGLTLNLIHRESPLSPFYNPSKSQFSCLHDAFDRSFKRINHFRSVLSESDRKIVTSIHATGGEFLVNISIGTPPVEVLAIVDTGSDLTWTQCLPCEECFKQKLPLFNPKHSSTYKTISCGTNTCDALDEASCGVAQKPCLFRYSYADGSTTSGDLFSDTVTLNEGGENPVSLSKITFGCAHQSGGTFSGVESGILGLGGGKLSFISQLGDSIGRKFSYCLPSDLKSPGKLSFGKDAEVSASFGGITTPLIKKIPDTFFYVTLEGITVGNKRVSSKNNKGSSQSFALFDGGNIVVDSGTTLTFLPNGFYDDLVTAVESAVKYGKKATDPTGSLSLCYLASNDIEFPNLTAHFKGGDLVLKPVNTFVEITEGVVCFSMVGTTDFAIWGNLAQIDFLVGYDLEARELNIVPTDCDKQK